MDIYIYQFWSDLEEKYHQRKLPRSDLPGISVQDCSPYDPILYRTIIDIDFDIFS